MTPDERTQIRERAQYTDDFGKDATEAILALDAALTEALWYVSDYRSALLEGEQTFDATLDRAEAAEARSAALEEFAGAAEAYCWDRKDETFAALMNARAAYQTAEGLRKLAALSPPAEETTA